MADWEQAWHGEAAADERELLHIFRPSLLLDKDVVIIAAYQQQQIVAGYEGGAKLTAMQRLAFEAVGSLRVWIGPDAPE